MTIDRALIIREPWISLILRGEKTWEMRSTPTSLRGWIGLAAQGRGEIVGLARLVDSRLPLTEANYDRHFGEHAIPPEQTAWAIENNWVFPWVLADVIALPRPIPFPQRPGPVKFVNLDVDVAEALSAFSHAPAATMAVQPRAEIAKPSQDPPRAAMRAGPAPSAPVADGFPQVAGERPIFVFAPQQAKARAIPSGGKRLTVLKGSTAMRSGSPLEKRDSAFRDGLVRQGVLAPTSDANLYVFTRDYEFDSASRAAGVVKDGNSSGPQQWKDPTTRKTFKDYLDRGGQP